MAQYLLIKQYDCRSLVMVVKMKYLFACLMMPIIPILLIVFFAIGALYFGVTNRMERMG